MIEYDEDEHTSALVKASGELKRVDHLIFVSLKYTRTVDVIKNIIHRLINCYDFIFDQLLEELEEKQIIYDIPTAPAMRVRLVKEHYGQGDEQLADYLTFYALLRQIDKSEYRALREFRRHVTMEAELPNGEVVEVNIDVSTEYYKKTSDFLQYAKLKYFS
jgi:hypothetical protein